jgi:hypothetical protein
MARVSKKKVVAGYLGYTPEAQRVDEITQALRSRSGIHFYNGCEVASVFDLVSLSREKYNEGRKRKAKCHIYDWHGVFEEAKESGIRLLVTVGHYLHTDTGPVFIEKEGSSETYFVALEDFPAYLDVVSDYHKVTAKRLREGWSKAMENRESSTFAYNF